MRAVWIALAALAAGCARKPAATGGPEPAEVPTTKAAPLEMVPELAPSTYVVTFHDVVPTKKGVWFDTTVREFVGLLDSWERAGATFVSLEQLDARLTEGAELPQDSILVTFSDGYRGVFELAWPVLRERRIPFVVFMHTGHVGSTSGRPKMDWRQLAELDRSGLGRVESQTVSHPADLTQMPDEAVLREFRESRAALEKHLGRPVTALAYPNGKFDARVSALAQEAGYRLAFTEEPQRAEVSPDLWRVGRFLHSRVPFP
jgi:biofilm PGA synthesis lipoprotein PgaB